MSLSKRQGEAILNLLGSLSGTAWKFCEDFNIDKAEDPDALNQILKILDGSFQYDSNVEMPADFSGYFENLARKPGQTLLSFVTDHDDRLKQIEKHGVRLPSQVQGWFLLAKASLTREKRQMIMTQAASLERPKVQQAMLAILGQDYKGGGNLLRDRWNRSNSGKGRSYFAGDDESTPDWGDEDTYYEEDDADYMNEEETMDDTWWETFDADAAYYQEDYDEPELEFDPGEYHEAYASYVDARKRFNDLKLRFVLSGETPMLVGRPVIKALDMTIDFSQQRIRFGNDDWQDAVLGRHEEYLLDLTSTFDSEQLSWEPSFDLQLDEQLGDSGSYDDFLTEESLYQVDDHLMPEFTVPLTTKHWKTLVMQSQAQLNTLNAAVDNTLREEHHAPPRVLWEVYTGRARLSKVAEAIGMTVKTFGYETGWNFALLSHQRAFLALQDEEMPDDVYLSPSCGPWFRMQNISATSEQRQEILRNLRDWHHRIHLQFCKRVTPNVINSLSGTTLAQDMGSWRQQWGYLSYEAWMVD
eukprot:g9465.t1